MAEVAGHGPLPCEFENAAQEVVIELCQEEAWAGGGGGGRGGGGKAVDIACPTGALPCRRRDVVHGSESVRRVWVLLPVLMLGPVDLCLPAAPLGRDETPPEKGWPRAVKCVGGDAA